MTKSNAVLAPEPIPGDMNSAVAAELRARRYGFKGLTLVALAALVEMKLTTLRQTLAGTRAIGVQEVFTFAQVFGVDPFELIASASQRLAK